MVNVRLKFKLNRTSLRVSARGAGGAGGLAEVAQIATVAALQTDNQTTDQNKTLPDLTSSPNERMIKI